MKNKKYYITLFLIMLISIFLLGLSYSKQNNTKVEYTSNEIIVDNSRIIYSNSNILSENNNQTDISIINNNKETKKYYITFQGLKENNNPIYINDVETNPEEAYVLTLDALGGKNDHKTISIYSSPNDAYKINIKTEVPNTLEKNILDSQFIYKDNEGNYRYFSQNPNNYIKYNNDIYQIVGIINNKVRIINTTENRNMFNSDIKYPNIKDYIKSFNNDEVNLNNTTSYNTWMNIEDPFWAINDEDPENHYYISKYYGIDIDLPEETNVERYIVEISPETIIKSGNGDINEPYEVDYES